MVYTGLRESTPSFSTSEQIVSCTEKIFVKAPLRIETYRKILKDTSLPPEPGKFYAEYFEKLRGLLSFH